MKENPPLATIIPGAAVVALILLVAGGYAYGMSRVPSSGVASSIQAPITTLAPAPRIETSTPDYKLFAGEYAHYYIDYAIAGTLDSGPYEGYKLVVANADSGGMDVVTHVFATKDFKTFIVDTSTSTDPYNPAAQTFREGGEFNPGTVVGSGRISFTEPPSIVDEGNFALVRNGGVDWEDTASIASSTPLASNIPGLWLFAHPAGASSNRVSVETAQKLVFDYTLISKEGVKYNDEQMASSTLSRNEWNLNSVFYKSADLVTPAGIYGSYGPLTPSMCGSGGAQVLDSIAESDLVPIAATKRGVQLYTLKDPNNPLNKAEYDAKIAFVVDLFTSRDSAPSTIDRFVNGTSASVPVPTFAQYVAQHPVLVFKDTWGRWVGIGEVDYPIVSGGCGKPVIYLYPPKPTDVTVTFVNPVDFTVDIPTYRNGWNVRARSDGTLTDLQRGATNCSTIDVDRPGSEYAQSACGVGVYPYLYWAGEVTTSYPTAQGGWVVSRGDVAGFLTEKLTAMGLSEKERTDMESYWVPQLLKKDVPYYRMSFFQTQTMNEFIAMKITPTPDTVLRVFLDWSPLQSLPTVRPRPQSLTSLVRRGFTLVEWGGLER